MANDLTSNPWVIDTASATSLTTQRIKVKGVRWIGATTAGHTCVIQDDDSKVKWASVAPSSNYVEADTPTNSTPWNGIKVPTLGSGTLYIEF